VWNVIREGGKIILRKAMAYLKPVTAAQLIQGFDTMIS
jgi:hypothetical protein